VALRANNDTMLTHFISYDLSAMRKRIRKCVQRPLTALSLEATCLS
jgi:hypothetical protein